MAVGLKLAGKNDFVRVQEDINDNLTKLDEAIDFNLLATLGIEYGGILNNTEAKVAGKAYYDTTGKKLYKCTVNTSTNYADAGFFEALSNNDLLNRPYMIKWENKEDKGYIEYSNGYIELWDYIGTTSPVDNKFIEFPFGIKLKPNYGVSSSPYDNMQGGRNISIRSDFIGDGIYFSTSSGTPGSPSLAFYRVCGFKR